MSDINKVGELLKDRDRRCRKNYALGANECEDDPGLLGQDPGAQRWCLVGAIQHIAGGDGTAEAAQLRRDMFAVLGTWRLINIWDDASDEQQDEIVQKLLDYNA